MIGLGQQSLALARPTLLQQALSAIRRNNGTLLMVPDNYAGVFEDSTGITPVDALGDPIGLINDRTGANNATQATASQKPVVGRVPKRLGPETSSYGAGFSSTTGITGVGATLSTAANELTITSTSADGTDRAEIPLSGLVIGRTYAATVVARRGAQGTQQTIRTWTVGTFSAVTITSTASSSYTFQFVATAESGVARVYSQDSPGAVGDSAIVTSISVREVLEWTSAISFDGVNDFLQTGITTGNEGWVCAGVTFGGAAGANETVFGSGAINDTDRGVWMLRSGGLGENHMRISVGNGTARTTVLYTNAALRNTPRVVESGWDASNAIVGVDGVTTSAARTGSAGPSPATGVIANSSVTAHPLNGPMTALVYTPVLPSAADRALIRRWIGSLQGQTL